MIDKNKKLLGTLSGFKYDKPPVWLMRQAGRYLPEYRKTRKKAGSFLDLCFNPKLATEVTIQPLKRFDLDAAILFADILLIPNSLGQHLEFKEGEGPILKPITNLEDFKLLKKTEQIHTVLNPVYDAVSNIKSKLEKNITFIGFAGSPWTVSTYMIEGKGSKDHIKTKNFMLNFPDVFDELILKIQKATIEYLSKQIIAGVDAVKLFDSWAGSLPGPYIEKYSLEPMKKIAIELKKRFPDIPVIIFPRGVGPTYEKFAKVKEFDCIAIDSNMDLIWAKENIQKHKVIQGNLDPAYLISGGNELVKNTRNIVKNFSSSSHIFNLGHGITPDAKIKNVDLLLKTLNE
ncbi:MAG: uroporphyrinogen decarboxylase [Paracoccaceae bacterium]